MTTATIPETRSLPPASAAPLAADGHVLLRNISWETYELLLRDLAEEHFRLTFDNGDLEIMSPSPKHDRSGRLLGRLIYGYTDVMGINIASFGGATWRRRDRAKGLEADECYYVRNEPVVRGRDDIELPKDPPPDLAIEVDISRSALDRQQVYAGLIIPELWRWEDEQLLVYVLRQDGRYERAEQSPSFPGLPLGEITRFMSLRHGKSETEWAGMFRDWVRENLLK